MSNEDLLETSRKLGYSIANSIGAEAFIELQLSFATRLLPRFSDNPLIRIRQHVLLYWDQSYLKSTLIDEFAKTVPTGITADNISSLTPETLFGSISENRNDIVRPVLAGLHFAKIDEFLGFLGSGNTMRDIVNTLNTAMEGKPVARYLLKLGQPDFDKSKIEQLKEEGITYDPYKAKLSYQPDVCIWAASRPMDNRTYTYLRKSGHLYRYHVLQHEISDEEAERLFEEDFRPDLRLQEKLAAMNQRLTKINVKELRMPEKTVLSQILLPLKEIVKDEITVEKRRLAEIIDIRTKGDILREITAHAFLRTVTENDFKDIEKLEYTKDDLEFILRRIDHFIEFKINPLYVEEFTERKHRKKRPRNQVKESVLQFLSDKEVRQRKEIDDYVNSQIKVGTATISNALEDLLSEHRICQPKYGFYKLKEDCKTCKQKDTCSSDDKHVQINGGSR
jgi:hypothetical protein